MSDLMKAAMDVMQMERDSARREVKELRGQVERLTLQRDEWILAINIRGERIDRKDAEIARLRDENASDREVMSAWWEAWEEYAERSEGEITRLRSLLKGALVPCPACEGHAWIPNGDGSGETCERCVIYHGYVPVEVEP